MNELVNQVCERTGLSQDKAQEAVNTVIGYLKEKLPGPIANQLDSAVGGGQSSIGDLFKKTA
jgi:uncharacterized protein (DUF2267 family)